VSIVKKWHSLDRYNRFLISYPFWFLLLFGLFYWGKYWSLSPIGEYLDHLQRDFIMMVLNTLLDNKIVNYDIIINPRYHVVITPECNGFVPYFIFLAGILAYSCSIKNKIFWAILGYFIFTFVNLLRLYVVTVIVNSYLGTHCKRSTYFDTVLINTFSYHCDLFLVSSLKNSVLKQS